MLMKDGDLAQDALYLKKRWSRGPEPTEPSSFNCNNRKVPKFSDTKKLCCNHPKTGKKRFYPRIMHPKNADSIANSEDTDQTAPLGAV